MTATADRKVEVVTIGGVTTGGGVCSVSFEQEKRISKNTIGSCNNHLFLNNIEYLMLIFINFLLCFLMI